MRLVHRVSILVLFLMITFLNTGLALAAGTLYLPLGTEMISTEGFYGDSALDVVVIPEGCKLIGERAFANCNLNRIVLPSSISSIASTAFNGNTRMKVVAESGSFAYTWAKENGFDLLNDIGPTIAVHHPTIGDIFDAGTIEMWNGSAEQNWTVTSNCDWTITKSGSWFNVNKTSGSEGTSNIKLTMADGASAGETRTGSITFKVDGNIYKTVNIKQVGPDKTLVVTHETLGDIITASPVYMYNGAGHQTWTVTSNAAWTLKKSGSWFTVDKTSGSAGVTTVVLNFTNGASEGTSRSGTLTFYFGSSLYASVTIKQSGEVDSDPEESISVVHPYAGDIISQGHFNLTNRENQTATISVFANFNWTITPTGDWFTVSPVNGSKNQKTDVTITTTSYAPSTYNRGTLTFKKGTTTKATITLYQGVSDTYSPTNYYDSFTVTNPILGNVIYQDPINMYNGQGVQNWSVVSNVAWTLTKSGSWFSVDNYSGAARTSTNVKITIPDAARPGEIRTGYIKFTYNINGSTMDTTINIRQDGGAAPAYTLAASHETLGNVFDASPIKVHNALPAEMNWTITSNKAWSITKSGNWFTVTPTSGSANTENNPTTNVNIKITDYARPGTQNNGTLTFKVDGSNYKTVNIYQDGGEVGMTLGSNIFGDIFGLGTVSLDNSKTSDTWTLVTNADWSVSKSGNWFNISPSSGLGSNSPVNFQLTINSLPAVGEEYSGSLTFYLNGNSYKTINLILMNYAPSDRIENIFRRMQERADAWANYTWTPEYDVPVHNPNYYDESGKKKDTATEYYFKANQTYYGLPYTLNDSKYNIGEYNETTNPKGWKKDRKITPVKVYYEGDRGWKWTPEIGADCSGLVNDVLWFGDSTQIAHDGQTNVTGTNNKFKKIEWKDVHGGDVLRKNNGTHIIYVYARHENILTVVEQRGGSETLKCQHTTNRPEGGKYVCGQCKYCVGENKTGTIKHTIDITSGYSGYTPYRWKPLYGEQ